MLTGASYTRARSIIPALPLTRVVLPRLLGTGVWADPPPYAIHVGEMNRVRKECGIEPLPADLPGDGNREAMSCTPTSPSLVPTPTSPPTRCGICPWTPPLPNRTGGTVCSPIRNQVFIVWEFRAATRPSRALEALSSARRCARCDFRTNHAAPRAQRVCRRSAALH